MMEAGHYDRVLPALETAREKVLEDYNIATMFARLAHTALAKPAPARLEKPRMIWSERSFWPEAGRKGGLAEWALRNLILLADPKGELRLLNVQRRLEAMRSERRRKRQEHQERNA